MKKAFSIICLCIYIFFSQFVFKAVATTDFTQSGEEKICVTKKLHTFEGKHSCRQKNNTAVFALSINLIQEKIQRISFGEQFFAEERDFMYARFQGIFSQYAQGPPRPPDSIFQESTFLVSYVGVIFQLL